MAFELVCIYMGTPRSVSVYSFNQNIFSEEHKRLVVDVLWEPWPAHYRIHLLVYKIALKGEVYGMLYVYFDNSFLAFFACCVVL